MIARLATACCVARALMLPALMLPALMLPSIGYSADADIDRSTPSAFVKDAVITSKIKSRLAKEKLSSMLHVSVDTDNRGAVSLTGSARTQAAVERAGVIAKRVKGVTSVSNAIVVKADE